jgi:hypothetical protein
MSRCAGWQTHGFTFIVMLLYHESDRRLPHSILSHFLDRGFPGWRAQNCASIVLCPPNNTRSSAIYKLTGRLPGWRAQDCAYMIIIKFNSFLQVKINILNILLQSRNPNFECLFHNASKKTIFKDTFTPTGINDGA